MRLKHGKRIFSNNQSESSIVKANSLDTMPNRSKRDMSIGKKLSKKDRTAHFDEKNLLELRELKGKDYGFLYGWMCTPFPQQQQPVEPQELREKLRHVIGDMQASNLNLYGVEVADSKRQSYFGTDEERQNAFIAKRKQQQEGEFSITRQCPTNDMVHPPGPKIYSSFVGEAVLSIDMKRTSSYHIIETELAACGRDTIDSGPDGSEPSSAGSV